MRHVALTVALVGSLVSFLAGASARAGEIDSAVAGAFRDWGLKTCPEARAVRGVTGCLEYYRDIRARR